MAAVCLSADATAWTRTWAKRNAASEYASVAVSMPGLVRGIIGYEPDGPAARGLPEQRFEIPAGGVTHMVTNCNDSGPGSLREAVQKLAVSGDTINVSELACSTITLTSGAITSSKDSLALIGPGAERLTIDGGGNAGGSDRVFQSLSSATHLSLSSLTIANANHVGADVSGGCIYTRGDLSLFNTVVTGCTLVNSSTSGSVVARGGGVYVMGDLSAKYSTISDNTIVSVGSSASGGGAYVQGDLLAKYSTFSGNSASGGEDDDGRAGGLLVKGNVTIGGSTISGNHASFFAGAMALEGDGSDHATIINSTISGNTSGGFVGGIYVGQPLTLENSTVAFNDAAKYSEASYVLVSGVLVNDVAVDLQSTIIAGNSADAQPSDMQLVGFAIATGANNLVFAPGSATLPVDTLIGQDPQLAPLAWNSGHTMTHMPAAGSPVIDAGNNVAGLAYDQRSAGFPRVVGASADIGAFELDPDRIFTNGFD